jgi:hypothetical protein
MNDILVVVMLGVLFLIVLRAFALYYARRKAREAYHIAINRELAPRRTRVRHVGSTHLNC